MQAAVAKIVKMLSDERLERRCAAAMVLGELADKDPAVTKSLAECLVENNPTLQKYVLQSLSNLGAKKIGPHILPLLDSKDEEIREMARELLAKQGSRAAASLVPKLDNAPIARKRTVISTLAKSHNKEAFEQLLKLLPDHELGDTVLNALRSELEQMSEKNKKLLLNSLLEKLKNKNVQTDTVTIARIIRVLAYFRDASLVNTLLRFASSSHPVEVRLAAISALRHPLSASRSSTDAIKALCTYADDPDSKVARTAVNILSGVPLPEKFTELLLKLSEGQHAEARSLALQALGRSEDPKIINKLLNHLKGKDPAAREASRCALSRMDGIAVPLIKELETAKEGSEHATILCRLLYPHATKLKPTARQKIAELAVVALENSDPNKNHLLKLLQIADPKTYAATLSEQALTHKRARNHDRAFSLYVQLDQSNLLNDDERYIAAVSGLCASSSKKELGKASRTTDPILRQFVELIAAGYPAASKIKKERNLTPEDLFFVGFNFTESQNDDEKEFGGELLSHLVKKSPRS
ncbi:MAG: HEAT repeat domain-containing protein, partial [Pseudomonadota bacterium]